MAYDQERFQWSFDKIVFVFTFFTNLALSFQLFHLPYNIFRDIVQHFKLIPCSHFLPVPFYKMDTLYMSSVKSPSLVRLLSPSVFYGAASN